LAKEPTDTASALTILTLVYAPQRPDLLPIRSNRVDFPIQNRFVFGCIAAAGPIRPGAAEATHWCNWALAPGGIYSLNLKVPCNGRIEYFDFATCQFTPIHMLDKPTSIFGGLALSPEGKSLLFGQNELNESYILLMKNFR
jgi:hypothetical protein